jgi:hypothetical protein
LSLQLSVWRQTSRRSSQTNIPGGRHGRQRSPHQYKSLRSHSASCEIDVSMRGCESGNTEVEESAELGVLPGDHRLRHSRQKNYSMLCSIVECVN